jgi:hypothetical protein
MAKILSGGYAYENNFLPNKQESMPTPLAPAEPEQAPESWGEWGVRNIAKTPAKWYEMVRSGLGAGNIINTLAENIPAEIRNTPIPMPGSIGMQPGGGLGGLRRLLLPTTEEAGQELAAAHVPAYLRESRPGDIVPEFLLGELPFWVAGGAFKSVPRLLGAAGQSAAMGIGSAGLGAAGEELGEALNLPEPLKKTLGIAGGILGGIGGQRVLSHALNRPSKILPGQVFKKEEGLFEAEKVARLKSAENTLQEKLSKAATEYEPEIVAAQKQVRKAELAIPKDKVAFEKTKTKQINEVKKEVSNYTQKKAVLKEKINKGYSAARKLEKGQTGDTAELRARVNKIKDNLVGVNAEDEADILRAVTQVMEEGKAMTLGRAKTMHQNFNAQIFAPRGAQGQLKYMPKESSTFQRYMRDINQEVGNFIKKIGGEEHYKQWVPAEAANVKLSHMGRDEKAFLKSKTDEIKDIKQQQYSPERQMVLQQEKGIAAENLKTARKNYTDALNTTNQEHKALVDAIGKETYEDLLKSREKSNKLTALLADSLGAEGANRVTQWGAAGALAALGGLFGHLAGHGFIGATAGLLAKTGHTIFNEIKIARSVMKKHPELYKEYADIIKQFETLPKATILKNLDLMGYKIEQAQKEEKSEKPQEGKRIGGSRIISGGMI